MIGVSLLAGLFFLLGIFLINGKGAFLIAGFNTMPKEKKEQYNELAVCKLFGKTMFVSAFSVVLWIISDNYELNWLLIIGTVLFVGSIVFTLIYVNIGAKFKTNS